MLMEEDAECRWKKMQLEGDADGRGVFVIMSLDGLSTPSHCGGAFGISMFNILYSALNKNKEKTMNNVAQLFF